MDIQCGPDEQWDQSLQQCVPVDMGAGPGNTACPAGTTGTPPNCVPSSGDTGGGYVNCGPGEHPVFAPGGPAGGACVANGPITGGDSEDFGSFSMPDWQPFKYDFNFGNAPDFHARRFTAPKPEDILNDPSYKWRLDQSLEALQNSAASKGVARTGNTAKGLVDYAGHSASQEYGNAFDRSYKIYQGDVEQDLNEYRPKLITYQTNAAGKQRAQELSSQDLWRRYLSDMDWSKFLLSQGA